METEQISRVTAINKHLKHHMITTSPRRDLWWDNADAEIKAPWVWGSPKVPSF